MRWSHEALWLVAIVLIHAVGVAGRIGVDRLGAAAEPIVQMDYGLHLDRAAARAEAPSPWGFVWDPSFMAGAPIGGATDVDNELGWLGLEALHGLPRGQAWNLLLLALFTGVPLLPWLTGWLRADPPLRRLVAAALGAFLFWFMASEPPGYVRWGGYGWIVACAGAPLLWAGCMVTLERPRLRWALAGGAAIGVVGLSHGLIGVLVPGCVLAVLLRRPPADAWIRLALATGVAAAITLPAMWPVLASIGDAQALSDDFARYFQSGPEALRDAITRPDRIPAHLILGLALVSCWRRNGDRTHVELACMAWLLTLLALGSFLLPALAPAQPLRFVDPALFLAIPPVAGVVADSLAGRTRHERLALLCVACAIAIPQGIEWASSATGARRLNTRPNEHAAALTSFLRPRASSNQRLLVEDGGRHFGGDQAGAVHLVGHLQRTLKMPMIGGPHPVTSCRGFEATFVHGRLFRHPIESWSDDDLLALMHEYAIRTVVVWSEASVERFEAIGWRSFHRPGGFVVFHVPEETRLAEGADSLVVTCSLDRIDVQHATSSPTLLRIHHDPRFRVEPPLPMRRVPSQFQPYGFMEVDHGTVTSFTLHFDG